MIKKLFSHNHRIAPSESHEVNQLLNSIEMEVRNASRSQADLVSSIANISLNSPETYQFEWSGTTGAKEVPIFLDSKRHQAVSFKMIVKKRKTEADPLSLSGSVSIRLSFQRKLGVWATDCGNLHFRFTPYIASFDRSGPDFGNRYGGMFDKKAFRFQVTREETLIVEPPGTHFELILSHFQFVKRFL